MRGDGEGLRLQAEPDCVARPVWIAGYPGSGGLAGGISLEYRAIAAQNEFAALCERKLTALETAACGTRPRA